MEDDAMEDDAQADEQDELIDVVNEVFDEVDEIDVVDEIDRVDRVVVDDSTVDESDERDRAKDERVPRKRFRPEKCTEEEWDEGASLWRIYMKL